jgi:alkylation response protein AidB-like acyl-CoA dehydrogenase
MKFEFDEDQIELRRAIRAFLDREAPSTVVHEAAALEGDGFSREAWGRIVDEMELTKLAIPKQHGGAGASFVEVAIALEELGRTLLPVPYLPTVTAAGTVAGCGEREEVGEILTQIAAGSIATQALVSKLTARPDREAIRLDGVAEHVLDADNCDLVVVGARLGDEPALLALELGGDGIEIEPEEILDPTRRQATVRFGAAQSLQLCGPGAGAAALRRGRDLLSLALAVESLGAADRCLEMIAESLGGQVPGGSSETRRQRRTELAAELEAARSTVYQAVGFADDEPEQLHLVAPLARAACGEAFLHIATEAVQLHGAKDFAWERDANLFFRRAEATELLGGGSDAQRRLVAERHGAVS